MNVCRIAGWVANSVDPDQRPHSVAYYLSLHFCSGLSLRIRRVSTVIWLSRSKIFRTPPESVPIWWRYERKDCFMTITKWAMSHGPEFSYSFQFLLISGKYVNQNSRFTPTFNGKSRVSTITLRAAISLINQSGNKIKMAAPSIRKKTLTEKKCFFFCFFFPAIMPTFWLQKPSS